MDFVMFRFYRNQSSYKLPYGQMNTVHADICFSNIMMTHSVYWWLSNNHFIFSANKQKDYINCFKDFFKSIPDYGKVALLIFGTKGNDNLLVECEFLKFVNKRLYKEFKKLLNEENEDYIDYVKDQEESITERVFILFEIFSFKPNKARNLSETLF